VHSIYVLVSEKLTNFYERLGICLKQYIYLLFKHCITAYFFAFAGTLHLLKIFLMFVRKDTLERIWKFLEIVS